MKRKNHKILEHTFSVAFILMFSGCSMFEQNDFVLTKELFNDMTEKVFYDIYQTGIDNYRFEFKVVGSKTDTAKLFDYILNDATYGAMRIKCVDSNDSVFISTNLPTNTTYAKTPRGKIIILQHEN